MQEQGYSREEVVTEVSKMIATGGSWAHKELVKEDHAAIDAIFKREMKYQYQDKEINADFVVSSDLWTETRDYLSNKTQLEGDPTGFQGLDDLLGGGFRRGELTVLMAQAKTGKNTLYHNLVYKYLARGVPFGYASREMDPAREVVPDLLSIALQKNMYKEEAEEEHSKIVSRWPIYFAPGHGYFSEDKTKRFFEACKRAGVNHFLYDHFHRGLMFEDYQTTERQIKFLKSLTKTLDIHLNLIVQPKTLQEGQQLGLDTLRGGAIIGQELNNLLILTRVKDQTNVSKLTLEVARHKLAKPGKVYLKYDPETITMMEIDKGSVSDMPSVPKAVEPHWKNLRATQ